MVNNLRTRTDEELVRAAREGDPAAEEYLIEKYRGLAKEKSKTYFIMGADAEDVIQEGMIGIFKAIRDFDEEGESSFRTFAELCITRQIQTAVQGANRKKHQILNNSLSLNQEKDDQGDGASIIDRISGAQTADPAAMAINAELMSALQDGRGPGLSSLESQVWQCLQKGMTYREIASALGRSPKSIDNAIQRVRKKIIAAFQ